jgi:hypothetical protein
MTWRRNGRMDQIELSFIRPIDMVLITGAPTWGVSVVANDRDPRLRAVISRQTEFSYWGGRLTY